MTGTRRETRARQTLQEFYEQLDRKWREAEELLLALSVPAPVTQPIRTAEPESPRAPRYRHELGFIKHYGRWGLCYGVCSEDDPRDQYWTSIHRCSIEQRVEAAQAFPALRDHVLHAAERYTDTVAQALSALSGSLAPETAAAEPASQAGSQAAEPHADEAVHEAESEDLLADERSEPPASTQDAHTEGSLETTAAVPDSSSDEPLISAEAEILGPIEPDRSLILWSAPECSDADAHTSNAPAPGAVFDSTPGDEPPIIILPPSLQRWESDGGEIAREAA